MQEALTHLAAEVFEAGDQLVITAHTRSRVEEELDRLEQLGAKVVSEITEFGGKWLASCARPDIPTFTRVAQLGNTRIATGKTREAVTAKVERLKVEAGAVVVSDTECINNVWTAVCELRAKRVCICGQAPDGSAGRGDAIIMRTFGYCRMLVQPHVFARIWTAL